jgi:hypothetical protein
MRWQSAAFLTCLVLKLSIWIPAAEASNETVEEHIRRVADGLLPTVVVEGQAPVTMSIFGEMNTLHVPGVSITVIHDGKIE